MSDLYSKLAHIFSFPILNTLFSSRKFCTTNVKQLWFLFDQFFSKFWRMHCSCSVWIFTRSPMLLYFFVLHLVTSFGRFSFIFINSFTSNHAFEVRGYSLIRKEGSIVDIWIPYPGKYIKIKIVFEELKQNLMIFIIKTYLMILPIILSVTFLPSHNRDIFLHKPTINRLFQVSNWHMTVLKK